MNGKAATLRILSSAAFSRSAVHILIVLDVSRISLFISESPLCWLRLLSYIPAGVALSLRYPNLYGLDERLLPRTRRLSRRSMTGYRHGFRKNIFDRPL